MDLNCKLNKSFCFILCFCILKINLYQFFHAKVEMGDECDKQLNLGNFVSDEENHERKPWKFFRQMCCNSRLLKSHLTLKKSRPYNFWLKSQRHYLFCFSTECLKTGLEPCVWLLFIGQWTFDPFQMDQPQNSP